jgi:hypothetical protein
MNANSLRKRGLTTLALLLIFALVGCLPFPLGDPEKSQVDPKLAGYWASASDDQKEIVAMWPFDQHTYVLEDLKLKKEDGKWQPQGPPQVFKAWLTPVRGQPFLTLEFLPQRLTTSTDQKVYPVLRLTAATDGMLVRMVKAEFEPLKKVKSSAEVEAIITRELDNPDLYGDEGMKFRKLDPDNDKEMIQLLGVN